MQKEMLAGVLLAGLCCALVVTAGCGRDNPVFKTPESLARLKAVSTVTTADHPLGGLPEKTEPVSFVAGHARGLMHAYRLPACYEWSYVDANGWPEDETKPLRFMIEKGQRFQKALDDFIANSGGRMELQCIRGIPCLVPSKPEATASALDDMVSLHVDNVVREALCAIFAVSPQQCGFDYTNSPNKSLQPPLEGFLTIVFFNEEGVQTYGRRSTAEEILNPTFQRTPQKSPGIPEVR